MKAHVLIVARMSILFFTFVIYHRLLFSAEVPVIIRTVGSSAGPSQIWYIHPGTCDIKKVGETGTSGLGSLAKNSFGALFSVNYEGTLVTINSTTGQATAIAVLNGINTPSIRALTFDLSGNLFAIHTNPAQWEDQESKLYKINVITGTATFVGGMGLSGLQALTTGPDGKIYAWDVGRNLYWSAGLVIVDPQTGTTSDVNPADNEDTLGHTPKPDIQTLMFSPDGTFYGIGNGNVYTIDINTGQATMMCFGITFGDGIGGEFVVADWIPKGCHWLSFFGGRLYCLSLTLMRITIAIFVLIIIGGVVARWYRRKKS